MEEVILRRHPLKFYLPLIMLVCTVSYLAFLLCRKFFQPAMRYGFRQTNLLGLISGLVLLGIGVYVCYCFIRNAPIAKANINKFIIGKREYVWADIVDVSYSDILPYKRLGNRMFGMRISFADGSDYYLYDYCYLNLPRLKLYMRQVISQSSCIELESQYYNTVIQYGKVEIFKGYQLLCFHGVFLLLVILVEIFFLLANWFHIWLVILLVISNARMLYFFKAYEDGIVVKNHVFFWVNTSYKYADIDRVVFERIGKLPTGLRIVTKDFESKLYPADSLWSKNWLALKARFERSGIPILNQHIL